MKNDRVMLITGARKGIGKYLAEYYVGRNYRVVGCSRQQSDLSADNYCHYCVDVSNEQEVVNMFDLMRKEYGRLDILINNAGVASYNHSMLTPYASLEQVFKTNTIGTFLMCREAAKLMSINKYGRIVNFTSVAVPLRTAGEAAYAASKAGIATLTQILSKELSSFNITCNAIGPTPVDTEILQIIPKKKIEEIIKLQAIKRIGRFADISNVLDFFIKEESDFISGQIIYLGGVAN